MTEECKYFVDEEKKKQKNNLVKSKLIIKKV